MPTDAELAAALPLNPRVFAILMVLLEAPSHGYGLKQAVEERSAGRIRLDPGSMYRSIARMVDDAWIEAVDPPAAPDSDARRRYYGVTSLGRRVARAEAERLRSLLDRADRASLLGES